MIHQSVATSTQAPLTSTVAYTELTDSTAAGMQLGNRIAYAFHDQPADAVIIFASCIHDYQKLLRAAKKAARAKILIGCTSAGAFIHNKANDQSVCAIAFRSDEMKFTVGSSRTILTDTDQVARNIIASFSGLADDTYPYRSALLLADTSTGCADALVNSLYQVTSGMYQFFGGGASEDVPQGKPQVFLGTKAQSNTTVALEILSRKPIGVGVRHGWTSASKRMRVTEAEGTTLISINSVPAIDIFKEHAKTTGQTFDDANPCDFFIHNVVGIETANGYKLRVPFAVNPDGSVICAADISTGATIAIMKTSPQATTNAVRKATSDALRQIGKNQPATAFLFDCIATKMRIGPEAFTKEIQQTSNHLHVSQLAGFNTYGEIARIDGQFNGYHNCTAVVCVIPL